MLRLLMCLLVILFVCGYVHGQHPLYQGGGCTGGAPSSYSYYQPAPQLSGYSYGGYGYPQYQQFQQFQPQYNYSQPVNSYYSYPTYQPMLTGYGMPMTGFGQPHMDCSSGRCVLRY